MEQPKRLWSLDWLNFWMADVQTGVGPFLAAALTARGWNPGQIGTFLTLGGLTGLALQTPAGAVVDATRRKRTLIAAGIAGIVGSSLMLAYGKAFWTLFGAQLLLGAIGPFIGPAVTAITLGLVARSAFDARLGRNQSFNAAGNFVSALLMGWVGWHWGMRAIFLTVPFTAVPTLLSLAAIPANQINHEQARGAESGAAHGKSGLRILLADRSLLVFAVAAVLFHLSNAAMLPQLGEMLTRGQAREAAPFTSASVSITQLVVAFTAATFGKLSARYGPKSVLLVGFGVLPIRGVLYTLTGAVPLLLSIQILDGVANAIFGVASAVYIAQRTRGSGHFNLAMGAFGTAVGTGASFSNALAGFITQHAGFRSSFLVLAAIAGAAFLCLLFFVPSTAPDSTAAVPPSASLAVGKAQ
jgi:MFS family permease